MTHQKWVHSIEMLRRIKANEPFIHLCIDDGLPEHGEYDKPSDSYYDSIEKNGCNHILIKRAIPQ